MSAQMAAIVREQETLVRRLARFDGPTPERDAGSLRTIQERQRELREQLTAWTAELRTRAAALPPDYAQTAESAVRFAEAVEQLHITDPMEQSEKAAGNQDGRLAHRSASRALTLLQQLLTREEEGFGGMCKGQPTFQVNESARRTLEQMLQALHAAAGSGTATGSAMGAGDGYSAGGSSPLNVPMLGVGRGGEGSGGRGKGDGRGTSATEVPQVGDSGAAPFEDPASPRGESVPIELIPERYREAIKRYFTTDEKPKR